MRRRLIATRVLTVVFLTAVSSGASAQPTSGPGPGVLTIAETATRAVRGDFAHEAGNVAFEARRGPEERVEVAVVVNGLPFDVAWDPGAGEVRYHGHGGSLGVEGRRALQALSVALEKRWDPYTAPISIEKHFAFSAILYLSEAPAGHTIGKFSIDLEESELPGNVRSDDREEKPRASQPTVSPSRSSPA